MVIVACFLPSRLPKHSRQSYVCFRGNNILWFLHWSHFRTEHQLPRFRNHAAIVALETAPDMTLILSNEDVEKLLTMPECIDVLEEAYVELAEGRGISRTRSDCITPTSRPDAVYGLKSMDGVIPKLGIGAVRINSDIVTFPESAATTSGARKCRPPRTGAIAGWCCCSRPRTASRSRSCPTASCSACGSAPPTASASNISPARMPGRSASWARAGRPAPSSWRPARCARSRRSAASARTRTTARPSARQMSALLGVEVVPVEQTEDAIAGADIVMCATNTLDNDLLRALDQAGHASELHQAAGNRDEGAQARRSHRAPFP